MLLATVLLHFAHMCDTLCAPGPRGMVFAKNSDRPPGEVQVVWPAGRRATAGCTLRTQYLRIGDTGAHAALLSCPTWLWGAEHGVNEHAVAIGNERVATTHDVRAAAPALIGMDLVRLGLERARSAEEAVEVMGALVEAHGQGGIADAAHQDAYDSSFLVADPDHAFVLDTAGSVHASASFPAGTAISNRLTLGSDWTRGSRSLGRGDDFAQRFDPGEDTLYADVRLAASRAFLDAGASGGVTPAATAAHLRDHGRGPWGTPCARTGSSTTPRPTRLAEDVSGVSVCMHVRDRVVTSASMIAELPHGAGRDAPLRAWVAAGSPCVSIYVPCFPRAASGPTPFVPHELSGEEMWHAADRLRRSVEADPGALDEVRATLDPVEDELWSEADEVADHPGRWASTGATWGTRALDAMRTAL
jgi:secernin